MLRAFGRLARYERRPVLLLDGHALEATPTAVLNALSMTSMEPLPAVPRPSTASVADVIAYLNAARPLLLLDTFEELGPVPAATCARNFYHASTAVRRVVVARALRWRALRRRLVLADPPDRS